MDAQTKPSREALLTSRRRRFWRQIIVWGSVIAVATLASLFLVLEWVAHQPPAVRLTLTAQQIASMDVSLKQAGLDLHDGSFLKAQPFSPPWTSHSLLVPPSWLRQPVIGLILGSRRVRADLLLADLDVLQPVMERAYGGWDTAAARGWNWDQWFANWRKQLAAKGSAEISFDEAFAPVDALKAFQRDNHTQIPLGRVSTSDGSQTALLADAQPAPCSQIRAGGRSYSISVTDEAQHLRKAKLWRDGAEGFSEARYIALPSSFGTPQAVLCGDTWIGLMPAGNRDSGRLSFALTRFWGALKHDEPVIRRLGSGIVYVRLPTFDWSNYEKMPEAGWPQRRTGDRVLIVDLRNNGGGTEDFGLRVLQNWVDEGKLAPIGDLGIQINSSCLFAPLKWNASTRGAPTIEPGQKNYLQGLLDRMAQPYPPGCPRSVKTTPAKWSYPQRHFDPRPGEMRIIALVDSYCASDCELLAERLASLPETIVAGINTYGVGQFVQPVYSVLPHTGLEYRFALGASNFYGDNRSYDGYGLDVDVVLPDVDSMGTRQLRDFGEAVANWQDN